MAFDTGRSCAQAGRATTITTQTTSDRNGRILRMVPRRGSRLSIQRSTARRGTQPIAHEIEHRYGVGGPCRVALLYAMPAAAMAAEDLISSVQRCVHAANRIVSIRLSCRVEG